MNSTPSLPAVKAPLADVLAVLDRADATKIQRDVLLNAVLTVDTVHTKKDLEAAVDAHVNRAGPAHQATLSVFDFGWKRPKNETERRFHAEESRDAILGKQAGGRNVSMYALKHGLGFIAGIGGVTPFLAHFAFGAHWDDSIFWGFLCATLGLLSVPLLDSRVDNCARRRSRYEVCALSDEELDTYLAFPQTRAYLRSMRVSEVSTVLSGDRDRLHALSKDATAIRTFKAQITKQEARLTEWMQQHSGTEA